MLLLSLLMLLVTLVSSFDCETYLMEYRADDPNVISVSDREEFESRLCGALRTCHANPLLDSLLVYENDIDNCYQERGFAYNRTLVNRSSIGSYIKVLRDLDSARLRYDTESALCKDEMSSIVDSVRLRNGYLREYQYSRAPHVSGDVLLLLKSERAVFESNVGHQMKDLRRMSSVSSMQLRHITSLLSSLDDVYKLISDLQASSILAKIYFEEAVEIIKKSVVRSMIDLS